MLYLVNQFQTQKNELTKLQIPKEILNRLWSHTPSINRIVINDIKDQLLKAASNERLFVTVMSSLLNQLNLLIFSYVSQAKLLNWCFTL